MKSDEISNAPVLKKAESRKRFVVIAAIMCVAALTVGCIQGFASGSESASSATSGSGSAVSSASSGSGSAASSAVTGTISSNDFTQRDAGALPDEYNTSAMVNWGSRGCAACHDDLWATIYNITPTQHIMASGAIFGKTMDWKDCESCHSLHDTRAGVYLGDMMHSAHYSSTVFTETDNGNCWSCHATDTSGNYVMWDDYKYNQQLAGYGEITDSSKPFFAQRGYDSDTPIGISVLSADEVNVDVTLNQEPSTEEQRYEACNFEIIDVPDASTWTIDITGVVNPQSFTLADLEANFEKHTQQVTQVCFVNGVNSSMEDSFEASGYLLSDIIDYCGGLTGDPTVLAAASQGENGDGWDFNIPLQDAMDQGAFIATEYYGHELTAKQGYPATLVVPGMPGACWVKYLQSIDFSSTATPTAPFGDLGGLDGVHIYGCNSAWFNPATDGQEFKVGETIDLQGFAWVWGFEGHATSQVQFSWDYGKTWVTADVPSDADPINWERFDANWTPTEAGTYVIEVQCVDAGGWTQKKPASVLLTVAE